MAGAGLGSRRSVRQWNAHRPRHDAPASRRARRPRGPPPPERDLPVHRRRDLPPEDDPPEQGFRYDHEVKRAAPYLLFAGVTLAVFWKFPLFGQTLSAMPAIESQFGRTPQTVSGIRHTGISDNVVVLAGLLRLYNDGLKANELRLWNPNLFCGLPAYANPMLHPFYPPN